MIKKILNTMCAVALSLGIMTSLVAAPRPFQLDPGYTVPKIEKTKAVYITRWTADYRKARIPIEKMIEDTKLNTIITDVKYDDGKVSIPLDFTKGYDITAKEVKNFEWVVERLAKKDIRLISRFVIAKDKFLSEFEDGKYSIKNGSEKSKFVDLNSRFVRDYNIEVIKESMQKIRGWTEKGLERKVKYGELTVMIDYIRNPDRVDVPRPFFPFLHKDVKGSVAVNKFLKELRKELPDDIKIAACVYGVTVRHCEEYRRKHLNGIGQILEDMCDALNPRDIICPMIYADHYPLHEKTWENVYKHVSDECSNAKKIVEPRGLDVLPFIMGSKGLKKCREYLDKNKISHVKFMEDQIKACKEQNVGYLVWNSSNKYQATYAAASNMPQTVLANIGEDLKIHVEADSLTEQIVDRPVTPVQGLD